jgi:predicted nucleic acid-binding protein
VLDASAVIEWLRYSEKGMRIHRRTAGPDATLHAPHLLDVEVAQVFRRSVLAGALPSGRAAQALEDLALLPIYRHSHDSLLFRIWELRHNLTAYDAAYVAVAELLDAPLITCDRRMSTAPGIRVPIEIF